MRKRPASCTPGAASEDVALPAASPARAHLPDSDASSDQVARKRARPLSRTRGTDGPAGLSADAPEPLGPDRPEALSDDASSAQHKTGDAAEANLPTSPVTGDVSDDADAGPAAEETPPSPRKRRLRETLERLESTVAELAARVAALERPQRAGTPSSRRTPATPRGNLERALPGSPSTANPTAAGSDRTQFERDLRRIDQYLDEFQLGGHPGFNKWTADRAALDNAATPDREGLAGKLRQNLRKAKSNQKLKTEPG